MYGDELADFDTLYSDDDLRRGTGMSKEEYRKAAEKLLEKGKNDAGYKEGKPYWTTTENFLIFADSRFRRNKGSYQKGFLEKAKFIAYGDFRMSDFGVYADLLLPCKTPYESWDIRTNPGYHRFANLAYTAPNLKPIGEAKSEWEIALLLVQKLEALAKAKFAATKDERYLKVPDATHSKSGLRPLDELVREFTSEGKLGTDKAAVEYALEHVEQFKPNTLKSMYERGGFLTLNDKAGKSSPLYEDRPYNTFENQLFLHQRFETLTGRLTFYVDHPLWIQSNAHVPTAKPPIRPSRHPFVLMSPHARWSIHSTYKTSSILLRLQRGKPYVMVNPQVAKAKGIQDGDNIRMFNELGEVVIQAKLSPACPPDALVMEHGLRTVHVPKEEGPQFHHWRHCEPARALRWLGPPQVWHQLGRQSARLREHHGYREGDDMSARQLAMVMDLDGFIGCQTCTVACKTQWTNRNGREYMYWNNVETPLAMGTPRSGKGWAGFDELGNLKDGVVPSKYSEYGVPWDYNHDDIMKGELLKPSSEPKVGPNWDEDVGAGDFPNSYFFYLPRICNHCSNPGCLAACPRGAIFKRSQDGIVLVDLNRCEGYKLCIAGCPYRDLLQPQTLQVQCMSLRIEKGLPPACAQQCVGRIHSWAIWTTRESQVYKLVHQYQVALPLHPEYGTQPNVYYVPPMAGPRKFDKLGKPIEGSERIPKGYLESLFGPKVHEALQVLERETKARKAGKPSELLESAHRVQAQRDVPASRPSARGSRFRCCHEGAGWRAC